MKAGRSRTSAWLVSARVYFQQAARGFRKGLFAEAFSFLSVYSCFFVFFCLQLLSVWCSTKPQWVIWAMMQQPIFGCDNHLCGNMMDCPFLAFHDHCWPLTHFAVQELDIITVMVVRYLHISYGQYFKLKQCCYMQQRKKNPTWERGTGWYN